MARLLRCGKCWTEKSRSCWLHDEDDHGWQFIGSSDALVEDGRVVCLEHVVNHDPSVLEVADLKPGSHAVREYVGGPWTRYESPPDSDYD